MSVLFTYHLLTSLLAGDRDGGLELLMNSETDWERLTALANHHFVLQMLWPRIENNDIANLIPTEAADFFREVTELSVKRNENILKQMQEINHNLNGIGIEPVYLKGAALLAEGIHPWPGDRIMFDIDLLVPVSQLEIAAQSLIESGYYQKVAYHASLGNPKKHFPRLYHPDRPAPVEIHHSPVMKRYQRYLSADKVFSEAKKPDQMKGCLVPSTVHKIQHIFIHSQLEHRGHLFGTFFLRDLSDIKLLASQTDPVQALYIDLPFRRQAAGYIAACDDAFGTKWKLRCGHKPFGRIFLLRHRINLRTNWVLRFINLYIRITGSFIRKPLLAIKNTKVRKQLIEKLLSKEWYKKQYRWYNKMLGRN